MPNQDSWLKLTQEMADIRRRIGLQLKMRHTFKYYQQLPADMTADETAGFVYEDVDRVILALEGEFRSKYELRRSIIDNQYARLGFTKIPSLQQLKNRFQEIQSKRVLEITDLGNAIFILRRTIATEEKHGLLEPPDYQSLQNLTCKLQTVLDEYELEKKAYEALI